MSSIPPPERHAPPAPRGPGAGARQSSLREANLRLVLSTVCAAETPLSRAGVAATTHMTRSTASRLVDELVAGGLLTELARPAGSGPGRPATPLGVARGTVAALGLQVNAGFLAAQVVDLSGATLAARVVAGDFVGSSPSQVLARLADLAREVSAQAAPAPRFVGARVALPGLVTSDPGTTLLRAPNLGWSDLDVAAGLGPLLTPAGETIPVRLGNEADLAALTVATTAPGRPGPVADFVYLSGEIGIGGAIVLDGAVMSGRHGWAGEIGHVCVDPDGPACRCGSTGCLEQYAGRRALLRAAGMPHATPAELVEAVRAGDATARAALGAATRALGVALAGVVNVLDVPTIVLGGHLGQLADVLEDDLRDLLATRILSAGWVPPAIASATDPTAGARGAALRELASVLAEPARWLA